MVTKNFLFQLACLSLLALAGCKTADHKNENQQPIIFSKNTQAMQTALTPSTNPADAASTSVQTPLGAAPGEVLPVGVYFGPGAMRAYAHVGVLKALAQAQVPIVSVGGAEWGSVVAALYSFSKSANDVEWQMLKLRRDQLPLASFIKKEVETREYEAFESFLRFVFNDKDLETGKVPFLCPATDGVQSLLLRSGKAWEQLLKCGSLPPFYKSYTGWSSGAISEIDWAESMYKDGAKFIIYVDVLGEEPLFSKSHFANQEGSRLFWSAVKNMSHEQYRQANMILTVPINEDLLDFDNRREAIKAGEKFASGVMPDLLKVIGVK